MTRLPHPACVWTANLLVPGAGLVLAGRLRDGAVGGVVWGVAVGVVLMHFIWPDTVGAGAAAAMAAIAAGVWLAWQAMLWRTLRTRRQALAAAARDEQFKAALVAYLQGRNDESEAICRALLKTDPDDVEATLQLAAVARRRGEPAAARRHLLRARYLDDDGRWDFEIERELAAIGPRNV